MHVSPWQPTTNRIVRKEIAHTCTCYDRKYAERALCQRGGGGADVRLFTKSYIGIWEKPPRNEGAPTKACWEEKWARGRQTEGETCGGWRKSLNADKTLSKLSKLSTIIME